MRITRGAMVLAVLLASVAPARAADLDAVVTLSLEGVVDPFIASYIEKGISEAESEEALAVLIEVDTPGGLDSSMRKIVQATLGARVPVICFVSPQGARAASAGTFIVMACDVAAMSPGTNIGAAHPVGVSGAIQSQKVTNDSVAFIRSIAEETGRNADWAERAVRDSESISAEEALELKVIDVIAPTASALLRDIDGRTVDVAGRDVTLATAGAALERRELGSGARILHPLFTPNLAFIFFYAGLILIVVELISPGVSVPGILGVVFLSIAFAAFGMLPIQIVGAALLVASAGFFLVELKFPGIGAPVFVGIGCLIAGGLLLFDRSVPGASVAPGVIIPVALAAGGFFAFIVQSAMKARKQPPAHALSRLVGATGYASTDIGASGVAQVESETWSARSALPVRKGEPIRVVSVEGLRVTVEPLEGEPKVAPVAGGQEEAE